MRKTFHSYQQLETSDCGLACIKSICRYYGRKVSFSYLHSIIDTNRLGCSIAELQNALRILGFDCTVVKVKNTKLNNMPLPAILYWKQKHFVTLYRIDQRYYYIADPAEGKLRFSSKDFNQNFCQETQYGISLIMEPTETFYSLTNTKEHSDGIITLIKTSIKKYRKDFLLVIIFTAIAMTADILLPFVFQRTIDEGINGGNINIIWLLILGQFFVFLGNYLCNAIVDIVVTKLSLKVSINMLNEYLQKLINLPISFFNKKVSSDLLQKVEDHNRIKNFLLDLPETTLFTSLSIIVFSSLLIYFEPRIFFLFIAFTLISFGWSILFLRYRREIDYSLYSNISENRNNLFELIDGIDEIKANNAHLTRVNIWSDIQNKINSLSLKSSLYRIYQSGGNSLLTRIRDVIITGICASLVVKGQMTIGIMMTLSYIVGRLSIPFSRFISSINSAQDASISYERIDEINKSIINKKPQETNFNISDICLNKVSFKYSGSSSPYVINDISKKIKVGQTTAIVGPSGCGKSTLIKLILGFYKPTKGQIYIGNVNLSNLSEFQWISKIAIVLQNGKLFSSSILGNIALADEKPNISLAMHAAKLACIDDFIQSLPMGIHTRIGKTGIDISGGQQQRIIIARAIYRNPQILILDEATSSLDAITEANIMANLYAEFRNRTIIIAAHRLSTIKNADDIIVMEKGKIAEEGNHQFLIDLHGKYYNLIHNQIA